MRFNNDTVEFGRETLIDCDANSVATDPGGSTFSTIRDGFVNPLPVGLILDPSRIPNPTTGAVAGPNRNFPGLEVTFSVPLRQANGNVVPAGVNLAPLFDIAGSEIDAQGRVRVTADWVVGASLLVPQDQKTVTITAKVTDTLGRTGAVRRWRMA